MTLAAAPAPWHHEGVPSIYHEGSRSLQVRFDTVRLADRIEERSFEEATIDEDDNAFIEARDMFFLATADGDGRPHCSYKGGEPGFVRVLDERTIAFPSYDGNGMYLLAGNALVNPHVGLLFIDFERRKRLRLNGDRLGRRRRPAARGVPGGAARRAGAATQVFPNCPRYIHQYQLVERSRFVPKQSCRTPAPAWKTQEWAKIKNFYMFQRFFGVLFLFGNHPYLMTGFYKFPDQKKGMIFNAPYGRIKNRTVYQYFHNVNYKTLFLSAFPQFPHFDFN